MLSVGCPTLGRMSNPGSCQLIELVAGDRSISGVISTTSTVWAIHATCIGTASVLVRPTSSTAFSLLEETRKTIPELAQARKSLRLVQWPKVVERISESMAIAEAEWARSLGRTTI
jgi:hypothetical protein